MSGSHNSWVTAPNPPPGQAQTDHSQQSYRLPPPPGFVYSAPSDPQHIYTHTPVQPSRQAAPFQPPVGSTPVGSAPVPPTSSYTQTLHRAPYYNSEHDAKYHPRNLHSPRPPIHYPHPKSRESMPSEVQQRHPQTLPQPMRHDQQQAHAITTQYPSPHWQSHAHPTMGLCQSTTRSGAPSSSAAENRIRTSDIPNLLGEDKAPAVQNMKFHLVMRQQPKAARACGSGERDRRNIDPPPIVQLRIDAPGLARDEIDRYLRYEGYVVNCWIYDETGTYDASHMPSEYRYQRRLTGSLVGTPFYGRDENGQEGCFFPFSDLSVRTLGKYRLKFNLIMLDTTRPGQHRHFPILTEVFSDVFDVYTAKEFPGINESSRLVRTLREQGCIISIKKGNDKKRRPKDAEELSDDEDDVNDDTGSIQGKRKRSLVDS